MTALEPHTSEVVQAGERRSARIESLRAVAALAVLVSHVWLYSHGFAASSYDSFVHRVIAGGGFGVQLFFALSGFLIFRPFARRDFGEGASIDWRTYVRNRAVRILPLYWCAVVVLLVFTQNGGSLTQWWRFTFFAQSFSAKTAQTVDGPMWSLVVELHFYILLPFLAWALAKVCRGRRWSAIAVLVVLAVPSVVFRRFDPEPFSIWRYSLPGTFYGFVPGMVLALLQIEWKERRPRWLQQGALASADVWLAISAVLWLLTCVGDYDWAVPLTAFASFFTVGAVVLAARDGVLARTLDWRPLALIGVASYSLYIWHVPIIERLYTRSAFASFPRLFVVAVPLALLVAAVSYVVVEQPALRLRRSWVGRGAEAPKQSFTGWWGRRTVDQRWVGIVAVIGFVVRARTVMATRHLVLGSDPGDYDRLGRLLAAGKGFGTSVLSPSGGPTAFRPPLYPLFLGAVYKVTGDSIVAARLVQAVLGAASVALVWFIARTLFGRRTAYVAAALAAVYPPLVLATVALMSESIFIPLMLVAVLAALYARDGGPHATRWAVVAGAAAGLGMLARPNSVAMLPALVVLVLAWTRHEWQRGVALRRAGAVLAAVVVVIVPWEIRNVAVLHTFVPISDIDGYNVAGVYNSEAARSPYPTTYQFRPPSGVTALAPLFGDRSLDEVSLGAKLRTAGIDFLRDNPTAPVRAEAWNTFRMLELTGLNQSAQVAAESGYGRRTAALGMVSFWIMAALALGAIVTQRFRRTPIAFWCMPVLLWGGTALFLGDARLRAPVEPFVVLSASLLVAEVLSLAVARARRRTARTAPVDVELVPPDLSPVP